MIEQIKQALENTTVEGHREIEDNASEWLQYLIDELERKDARLFLANQQVEELRKTLETVQSLRNEKQSIEFRFGRALTIADQALEKMKP